MITRDDARRLDLVDPLASFRAEFLIPDDDLVYLDGNSLGRTPLATIERLRTVVESEWAADLITSWDHWLDMPRRVGDRMGAIIGSRPGEVAVHDNTRPVQPWEKSWFVLGAGDVYDMRARRVISYGATPRGGR